jgi:hypothetical protein
MNSYRIDMSNTYELGTINDVMLTNILQNHVEFSISRYENVYSMFKTPVISSRIHDTYAELLRCIDQIALDVDTEAVELEVNYIIQTHRVVFSISRDTNNVFSLGVRVCENVSHIAKRKAALLSSNHIDKKIKLTRKNTHTSP